MWVHYLDKHFVQHEFDNKLQKKKKKKRENKGKKLHSIIMCRVTYGSKTEVSDDCRIEFNCLFAFVCFVVLGCEWQNIHSFSQMGLH